MKQIEIRPEHYSDVAMIRSVTVSAFRQMPFAGGDEQDIIERLRTVGALSVSLVAVIEQKVVGHIAFSPARFSDASHPWFALGPISVLPKYQGQGIGSELIHRGMEELDKLDALGCILTGNPDYYRRFGFELFPDHAPVNEPADFFMLKLLKPVKLSGKFCFHDAFYHEV